MKVPQPKGYYSRLFPVPTRPLANSDEEKLIKLGEAMRYNVEREGTLTPRVGYTYFSQFVGHDLTHDPTPLDGPYLDPEQTLNHRTPYLDLDHVYGGGPKRSPDVYSGELRIRPRSRSHRQPFAVHTWKPKFYQVLLTSLLH